MMKPILVTGADGEETVYVCLHWRTFPNAWATHVEPIENLLANRTIDSAEAQRYEVWKKECGLIRMDAEVCKECPHIRRLDIQPHQVPKLYKTDGSHEWTPAVDIPTSASTARYRPRRTPKEAAQQSHQDKVDGEVAAIKREAAAKAAKTG